MAEATADTGVANPSPMAQTAIELLTPRIGKFTARKAIEIAANASRVSVSELEAQHQEIVVETLRPMLRTLLGGPTTERLLSKLQETLTAEVPS